MSSECICLGALAAQLSGSSSTSNIITPLLFVQFAHRLFAVFDIPIEWVEFNRHGFECALPPQMQNFMQN